MSEKVNINGVIRDTAEAVIPVMDHGFLFGDSVYETIRTYGGRLFRFDDHYKRLRGSAAALELRVPFTQDEIEERMRRTLAAAREPDAAVRIVVTRGVGPMPLDPDPCTSPNVLVFVRPRPRYPEGAYANGLSIAVVTRLRNARGAIDPNVKSGNYLNNVLASVEAKRAGAFEGVMLNGAGHVTECTTSNVFAVVNGAVVTPALDEGLLSGITRKVVLEICAKEGIAAREEGFGPDVLRGADEVFITSTLKQVMPVTTVDGRRIGAGVAGPVTLRLLAAYRELVKAETGVEPDRDS